MSLVRLLATGKSLVGLRDATGRYRVTDQRLLPKFGSESNPFQNRVQRDGVEDSGGEGGENLANAAVEPASENPSSAAVGSPAEPSEVKAAMGPAERPGFLSRLAKLGRIFRFPSLSRRMVSPKVATARVVKKPVQGELSLDRVRVVRNDLIDADLEVVPVLPGGGARQNNPFTKPAVGAGPVGRGQSHVPDALTAQGAAPVGGPRLEAQRDRKRFLFGRLAGEMKRTVLRKTGSSQA